MRERVLNWLKANVSEHRITHILGVEKMSVELAIAHGANVEKATQAGLMHDLAKFFPPQKLLSMAQTEGLELDSVFLHSPHLLHADVSAIVARDEFGIEDPEILDAIRNHTLGKPFMDELSCIVFLADALEINRGDSEELAKMRRVSQRHLHKAVRQTCDYSLHHLLNNQKTIHPRVILTRNWALQSSR
ncbi:MAG: bis(5'-nucleosyl)-tetraphosphatase (symmetrical) YqeK [Microcystaceae cyanobacterium]